MPDINFPSNASLNDLYTYNSKTWKWNGSAWEKSSSTETGNTEGNTGEIAYYSGKGSIIAGATAFFYDGDKVGIGTSGPTETLDVRGGITASGVLYAGGGATFGGPVQIHNAGDAVLTLYADSDNSGENDNPYIDFRQDGGGNSFQMGMVGDAGQIYYGSRQDVPYINSYWGMQVATGMTTRVDIDSTGLVHLYGGLSADMGATFGGDVNFLGDIVMADDGRIGGTVGSSEYFQFNIDGNVIYARTNNFDIENKLRHYGDSDTYMQYTDDKIAFFAGGTSGSIHMAAGLSADMGATFGGDVNIGSNSIRAGTNSTITDGSGNPIFDIVADRNVKLGDTDGSGNSTYITCRDYHSYVDIRGDSSINLQSDIVSVNETIRCNTDNDTKIVFYGGVSNQIDFIAGGVTFAGSKFINSVPRLYAPMGITVGYASGGAQGAGNIYTPYGVTCGQLEVGGYWAGEQSDYVGIAIDNGNRDITTGKKAHRIIPWDCEVVEWTISSADSGLIQWDINWCTYTDWPSTVSVGGSNLPAITLIANGKAQDTSVDWAKTTFAAGDIIEFEVDSVTSLTNCILSIKIRRTG